MGNVMDKLRSMWRWAKSTVSSVFVVLLCASFILWYILKLRYTYTTDYTVLLNINGEQMRVPCVIEGKGTNLFGYRINMRREIKIPLSDLKYTITNEAIVDGDTLQTEAYLIDPQSIQSAISVRFSDIKVISVGDVPPLQLSLDKADGQADDASKGADKNQQK